MRTPQAPHANAKPDPHQDPHPHANPDADGDPESHADAHHNPDDHGNVGDRPANGNGFGKFHRLEVGLAELHRLEVVGHAQLECLEDLGNQLTEFERVEVTEPDRSSVTHDRPFGVDVAWFPAEHRGPCDAGSLVHQQPGAARAGQPLCRGAAHASEHPSRPVGSVDRQRLGAGRERTRRHRPAAGIPLKRDA